MTFDQNSSRINKSRGTSRHRLQTQAHSVKLQPYNLIRETATNDPHLITLKQTDLSWQPHSYRDKNEGDLARLENKLSQIRQELKPIMSQLNQSSRKPAGPTAELLAASVGRLVKIHSEKLTNLLLDDLLVEMVAILNEKEETQKRLDIESDLKTMALALCEELNEVDIDQRFIHSNNIAIQKQNNPFSATHNSGNRDNLYYNVMPPPAIDIQKQYGLNFIHDLTEPGVKYKTNIKESGLYSTYNRDFDSKDIRKLHLTNSMLDKGPYKLDMPEEKTTLNLDPSLIMQIVRHQIVKEDKLQAVPYLRRKNVEATNAEIDVLIDECLNEVLHEFEDAQKEFVAQIIKEETSLE